MEDKMKTTQLAWAECQSFSAETTRKIRPKPKLAAAAAHPTETGKIAKFKATFTAGLVPKRNPDLKFDRPVITRPPNDSQEVLYFTYVLSVLVTQALIS